MTKQKQNNSWLEYCKLCKKNHITSMQECPSCGSYQTPQPTSEKIKDKHNHSNYKCDGCEAYEDHLK